MQSDEVAAGYIRGAGGVIDTRRLFRVIFGSAIVSLAVVVVVLTIQAAHKTSQIDALRHRGIPVDVTVTSCLGILSGTGITITSFQCSGSFDVAGRSYAAVIGGSNINHPAPPSALEGLKGVKGKSYEERSKNLPNVVETG